MSTRFALRSLTRVCFVWLGAGGLVANLVMDLAIYRRAASAVAARATREDGLRRLRRLYRVENALTDGRLIAARREIRALVPDADLASLGRRLDAGRLGDALRRAREARRDAEDALDQNLREDARRWRNPMVIPTLSLDVALLAILIGLGFYEWRRRERTERCLKASVVQLHAVSRGMEEKLRQIRVKNRTLVHNLKNPVGSIMGFAELIREQAPRPSTVESHSAVIERLSKNALARVEALLAEDAPEDADRRPLDLGALITDGRENLSGLALTKRQRVVTDVGELSGVVYGSESGLSEVISNLLGNAIKYSPPGATIRLRARATPDAAVVEIEDEGPGFAAEDRAKAFGFGQTLSAKPTGGESSTGYGLFVARQIVAAHGGRIELGRRADGPGARVTFTLPRVDAAHAQPV